MLLFFFLPLLLFGIFTFPFLKTGCRKREPRRQNGAGRAKARDGGAGGGEPCRLLGLAPPSPAKKP